MKKPYEKPQIADHGELTDVTAGHATGPKFDSNFKVGDPVPPDFLTGP